MYCVCVYVRVRMRVHVRVCATDCVDGGLWMGMMMRMDGFFGFAAGGGGGV